MNTYRLVCQGSDGHWFVVEHAALTAEAAFADVQRGGRKPRMVYPAGLPRSQEDHLLKAGRDVGGSLATCITCGYSLKGLAPDATTGLLICPECGVGAVPWTSDLHADHRSAEIARIFHPGRAYATVGVLLALVGLHNLYFGGAGVVLGAIALERSGGVRGQGAVVLGGIALIVRLMLAYGAL